MIMIVRNDEVQQVEKKKCHKLRKFTSYMRTSLALFTLVRMHNTCEKFRSCALTAYSHRQMADGRTTDYDDHQCSNG